jgi:tetratricopeptide (TPR) repeat protein
MTEEQRMSISEFHKKIAVETNNEIWPILDKANPTRQELEDAMHMAHASRYHWSKVGERINLARGDYMISRVYSAMGRPEPAIYHARRCLEITQETGIGDWDLGFAYEALTRAYAIAGDREQYEKYLRMAKEAIASVKSEEDRKTVQGELDKVVYKTS